MTESIIPYAWNYPLPYITISYATGQWFETEIWEKYHRQLPKDEPALTRVLMDGRPGAPPWVFFSQARGGTWDNWDNYLFKWIGDNLIITFILIVGIVASTGAMIFGATGIAKGFWKDRKGYERLGVLGHKSY
jgi:mannosyltransferase OCH1-like enzyme